MNFYESARFQYAAARLLVKLAQFRQNGKFVKKITNLSNFDIQLATLKDGSFNINIEDAEVPKDTAPFVDLSLADLVAYVSERLVGKIGDSNLTELAVNSHLKAASGAKKEKDPNKALEMLISDALEDDEFAKSLPSDIQDIIARRRAELYRAERLSVNSAAIAKIDFARSQKLIAMSAPLVSEMATALRKSADTLQVTSSSYPRSQSVLFLNQQMAREIETAVLDKEITPILGDITQFNKENGWGKLKIENGKIINFSIPVDILPVIRKTLINNMNKDQVYLQTYFVRDRSNEIIRLIVVGILQTPTE